MKVAFLLPRDLLSGGVFVPLEHASRFSRFGIEATIIFKHASPEDAQKASDEFNLEVISWQAALEREFDCVISSWWETAIEMYALKAKRYAHFIQSDERRFYDSDRVEVPLIDLLYKANVPVITEARWIKDLLKSEYKREAALSPNGVCRKTFFPDKRSEPDSGKLRVLVEGSASVPYKRVPLCFEILSALPDVEVWYACSEGFIDPNWKIDKFFSRVSRDQMRMIYSSCDVLLKLSTVEGFFCPPLEMMACGGTVVVSRVTGFDEFVVDGENGLVVDIDDKKAAIAALTKLIDDRDFLGRLKAAALETANRMNWDDPAKLFAEFLLSMPETKGLASDDQILRLRVLHGLYSERHSGPLQGQMRALVFDVDRQLREIVGYMNGQFAEIKAGLAK